MSVHTHRERRGQLKLKMAEVQYNRRQVGMIQLLKMQGEVNCSLSCLWILASGNAVYLGEVN